MYTDAQTKLADSQALTATALSENVIDLAGAYSYGNGEPLGVLVTVEVAADQTTGDEDYAFEVEVASDAAITTARQMLGRREFESGTPVAPAQDADLLVAGYQFVIPLPPLMDISEAQRYLALRATLAGTTPTITISADLLPLSMIDQNIDGGYAAGYSIT